MVFTIDELKDFIVFLKEHKVGHAKIGDIEIEFDPETSTVEGVLGNLSAEDLLYGSSN